ncbi:hypothetical protein IED13_27160 [Bosea sp. SSUT16]|uniref:Uncharacterized protein n=1 Tax=Bosea spartocytisi TaxID=2773451 RepID=A0A927EFF4_9HYPH|nr:hypothetical protein [Bosea spartocytisi]MBD3849395.1 hypothetical protein [Bosea spartocytisi]MCT4475014.1 hypothetical protein [Bosea spartocytisi]
MPDNDALIAELLDADVVGSLQGHAGGPSFPASDEGLEAQFFSSAHRFFRDWLDDKGGSKEGAAPCVVILSRAIAQDMKRLSAKKFWYFASTADADIEGKIFVASYDLKVVAEVPFSTCGHQNALGEALVKLGLDSSAHCLLRGDRAEMYLCPAGLNGGSTRLYVRPSSAVQLDAPAIDFQLWEFHRTFTQTPSGILLPWKGKADDRITIENAELRISLMLGFFLRIAVGQDNVTVEDQTPHGRVDVKISRHAMKDELGPTALECKVLRTRASAGKTARNVPADEMIKHASDGVQQAIEYRKDLKGKLAYLCCFDARDTDEDQPDIVMLAAANDVTLRRYYMYSSASAHRAAEAAAAGAGLKLSGAAG